MWHELHVFARLRMHCPSSFCLVCTQATDLAAGSQFGYRLLFVVLLASLCAMFLQYLSLKLGIAAERDLAQVRRRNACGESPCMPVTECIRP